MTTVWGQGGKKMGESIFGVKQLFSFERNRWQTRSVLSVDCDNAPGGKPCYRAY